MIINENFIPAGRASAMTVGTRVTAASQPVRRVLPQLIGDGLSEGDHLSAARALVHPFQRAPTTFPPISYALQHGFACADECNEHRRTAVLAIVALADVLKIENHMIINHTHPHVKAVLTSGGMVKNVAAMRELQHIFEMPDWGAVPFLLTGLPMCGHCDPVEGMLVRRVESEISTDQFVSERHEQQLRVLCRVGPSCDPSLDLAAFEKSEAEASRGVLLGPWDNLNDVPVDGPQCLVPRHGVWEQHGGAELPTVRVIDDLLVGGQNGTVSYETSHRPADGDALCAQQRATQEQFPASPTAGWTSDFAKAFKQVPHLPFFACLVIVALWNPKLLKKQFWIPCSQLFGGRSSPQNFSRYPAWFCYLLAIATVVALQHCVDDVLGMDRQSTVMSGWLAWREIAAALGWDVPDKKSPYPTQNYLAVGYRMQHRGTPTALARLRISANRRATLIAYIQTYLDECRITGAEASSLVGRLGFSLNAVQGRFGRAMLRSIRRRQYENRTNLNAQLLAALKWWKRFLRCHKPRYIPVSLKDRNVVISYSDGEGSGGVGVAVWHPDLARPRAAFMRVPWMLRRLWALQSSKAADGGELNDIFEIEAVGPLIILDKFPKLLKGMLWIHFIDNAAAQAALARGSSSVQSGDAIVSLTWLRIVELACLPWFDRVASKSNPVDGLSRGDMSGPWRSVEPARIPKGLLTVIRDELGQRGVKIPGQLKTLKKSLAKRTRP